MAPSRVCFCAPAGKSSFVNWYVGEEVQQTGVAVETQGFTVISSGKARQELGGRSLLALNKHLTQVVDRFDDKMRTAFLEKCVAMHGCFGLVWFGLVWFGLVWFCFWLVGLVVTGAAVAAPTIVAIAAVIAALSTLCVCVTFVPDPCSLHGVVSTSKRRHFASIDLIDTPGLVDGNVNYPFDVNAAICDVATIADLILVFLDPMGQALCSRTMDVVQELNRRGFHDRMRYYLTKADTVRRLDDLNKVVVQITQNLTKRVRNNFGFRLPTLSLPMSDDGHPVFNDELPVATEINRLGELCTDMHVTIQRKVQNNMATLQADSEAVSGRWELFVTLDTHTDSVWLVLRLCLCCVCAAAEQSAGGEAVGRDEQAQARTQVVLVPLGHPVPHPPRHCVHVLPGHLPVRTRHAACNGASCDWSCLIERHGG